VRHALSFRSVRIVTGRREKDGSLPGTAPANALPRPEAGQPPEGAPAIGEIIAGKYRVERVLGAGGMGVVVAALQLNLDTRVAIKFLLSGTLRNADAVARFTREARAAVRITNEHVARVLDVGSLDNGSPYIVMEFLEGTDLATRLKTLGRLTSEEAVEDVLQACEALSEAHGLGIVHRDLKPANLFCLRRPDGLPWIKVVDFGISKFLGDDPSSSQFAVTQSAVVMGSPAYMSPEQMQSSRDVDARSDIWALGVVLFELLTGRQPFDGESFAEVVLQVNTRPVPSVRELRSDCPEQLEQVIFRCLEKDRDKRFADVAALAMDLLPFAPLRARGSVERIARAAQRSSSISLTMTGQGIVPLQGSSPGGPVQTLTALGHTTSRHKGTARPLVWVAAAISTVALVLLAGAIRLMTKPKGEPAAAAAPAAVQAPAAPPSVRPQPEEPFLTPLPQPSSVVAPAVDDASALAAAPASAPREQKPLPQSKLNSNPNQHQKQKPASSTQPSKHEDIY
jgi:serine/threonine-protein kinase